MRKIPFFLITVLLLSGLSVTPVFAANNLALVGNTDVYIRTDKAYTETMTVRNNSDQTANNVTLGVSSLNLSVYLADDPSPFTLAPGESRAFDVEVFKESGGGSLNQTIRVSMRYTLGFARAEMNEYEDVDVGVTDDDTAPPAAEDNRAPNVIMTSPASAIQLRAGSAVNVDVTFKNTGTAPASNIVITPVPSKDFQLTGGGTNSRTSLTVNQTLETEFRIAADKDLTAGSYPVELNYTYYDSDRNPYTGTATFYVRVENDQSTSAPSLILKDFQISDSDIRNGEAFTITATVENTAAVAANSAQVTVGGLSPSVISMSNAVNNSFFDTVAPNETKKVSFSLAAYEKLKTNTYPITFTLKYKYTNTAAETTDYTNEYTYYVGVTNESGATDANKAMLSLENVLSPTGTYDTGQEFPVSMTITNTGKLAASNVKITAASPEGIVPKSASVQQILTLAPGVSQSVNFSFAPNALSATQNYSIEFKVDYENGIETETESGITEETDNFVQYASVNIVNSKADEEDDEEDEETAKSLPKIIISKYKATPAIVQAGQEFDLDLTFQNTHSTKSVHNIKALLTVPLNEDGEKTVNVFSPVDASNTFFVDSIAPKGTSEQHIRLSTVPDAVAKNYVLVIEFDYEDEDGTQITQTEEVGVNVRQTAKLELGEIPMPTNATVNQPIDLYFNVQNTGQVTLNNLKIKISGENFQTSDAEMIFGNYASGDYGEYYGSFVPLAPGEHPISVVVSYDEDTGEHVETTEDFTILVEDMPEMGMDGGRPGGMQMNPDGTMVGPDGVLLGPDGMPVDAAPEGVLGFLQANWIWIVIGAVIVAGAIITGVVLIRRKRKKGLEFDE